MTEVASTAFDEPEEFQRAVEELPPDKEFMRPSTGSHPVQKHRASFLTVLEQYNLNIACRPLHNFGYGTFHVGSSLRTRNFRDVDLRCILPNKEFDAMFGTPDDPRLKFLNVAISEWVQARTQLPIDFQFQRMTDANDEFPSPEHPRNCVGML